MKKLFLIFIFFVTTITNLNAQITFQEKSMWCWASCIQSALFQGNVYQTQSQIVTRFAGWPQNIPANNIQIISILNSYNFKAWSVQYPANPQQLYNTLFSGWKLIAFVNPTNNPQIGHFIILQGISANGLIIVSDPSSGLTYEQNLNSLYYAWNWSSSVIVGTP